MNRHEEESETEYDDTEEDDDEESGEEEDDDEESGEEEDDNEESGEEICENIPRPMETTGSMGSMTSLDKLTLDLMVNPMFLSRTNMDSYKQKKEQHARILKHKRDILKIVEKCLEALGEPDSYKRMKIGGVNLDIQNSFEHFAKLVLLDVVSSSKNADNQEIFSNCHDVNRVSLNNFS